MKKVDRIKALDKLADKLDGKNLLTNGVWLIMDKKRGVVAKGVPRNRYLCLVTDLKDRKRLLTYSSEAMARNGFKLSGFYNEKGVSEYFQKTYGISKEAYRSSYKKYLEPVKAVLSIKI